MIMIKSRKKVINVDYGKGKAELIFEIFVQEVENKERMERKVI